MTSRQTERRINQALGYAWSRNDQGYRDEKVGETDSWAFAHYFLTVAGSLTLQDAWSAWLTTSRMNDAQRRALVELCHRYGVEFDESAFVRGVFGLPDSYVSGYVSGQVGPIYVGVDDNGRVSS